MPGLTVRVACWFLAEASATAGSSITERELVMVEGNKIKGIAIPLSIPYRESASTGEQPESFKKVGSRIASALCNKLIVKRFPVIGREILNSSG